RDRPRHERLRQDDATASLWSYSSTFATGPLDPCGTGGIPRDDSVTDHRTLELSNPKRFRFTREKSDGVLRRALPAQSCLFPTLRFPIRTMARVRFQHLSRDGQPRKQ